MGWVRGHVGSSLFASPLAASSVSDHFKMDELDLLRVEKHLEYFCHLPKCQLAIPLSMQFSKEMDRAFQDELQLLRVLKQLKYFLNLPRNQLSILLEQFFMRLSKMRAWLRWSCRRSLPRTSRAPQILAMEDA